jgi:hypothetical protein
VSISYWDRFKIRSEQSQTKFKLKKGALRCVAHRFRERFFFHVLYVHILFSVVKNRRVKITEEKGISPKCTKQGTISTVIF